MHSNIGILLTNDLYTANMCVIDLQKCHKENIENQHGTSAREDVTKRQITSKCYKQALQQKHDSAGLIVTSQQSV